MKTKILAALGYILLPLFLVSCDEGKGINYVTVDDDSSAVVDDGSSESSAQPCPHNGVTQCKSVPISYIDTCGPRRGSRKMTGYAEVCYDHATGKMTVKILRAEWTSCPGDDGSS